MEEEYKENQRVISNKIIQGVIILILIILIFSIYKYLNTNIIELIFSLFIVVLLFALIFISNLSLCIDGKGIKIKYFPFHISTIIYKWEDIEALKVIMYNPTKDFLGWGIRKGRFGRKVKCFTTHGNQALYLKLKDGRIRIIGTQHPKELESFIKLNKNVLTLSLLI